jgi:regulator of sigma E protease
MDILIKTGQLMLSLTILVVLHELGHFLPARYFGTRVNKFYLFFDFLFPFPGLLNFSLFKFKRGDTEYGIGWFPFGGYVQIAGMEDETQDASSMGSEVQPWEFRGKKVWQRFIVMIGGVTVNFFLGMLLFMMILFVWGEKILPAENAVFGVSCDSLAEAHGFKDGDKLISITGKPISNIMKVRGDIFMDNPVSVTLNRDGQNIDIPVTKELSRALASYKGDFLRPNVPFILNKFTTSFNTKIGLQKGDRIIGLARQPTPYHSDVTRVLSENKSSARHLRFIRNEKDTMTTFIAINGNGKILAELKPIEDILTFKTTEYTFLTSIPAGANRGWETMTNYVRSLGKLFKKEVGVTESLGGFGTMANVFGTEWIWERFWIMTATISLILAFMNLLPIPMLDGGYIIFLMYEAITGRKPNEKFMEYAQMVGLVFILGLMVFSNGMDIIRAFR